MDLSTLLLFIDNSIELELRRYFENRSKKAKILRAFRIAKKKDRIKDSVSLAQQFGGNDRDNCSD